MRYRIRIRKKVKLRVRIIMRKYIMIMSYRVRMEITEKIRNLSIKMRDGSKHPNLTRVRFEKFFQKPPSPPQISYLQKV